MTIRSGVWTAAIAVLALFLAAGVAAAGEVAQGKCIAYDEANSVLKIEEYDTGITPDTPYGRGTGNEMAFDVSGAKIGIFPEPGDVLRIAFRADGDIRLASKVMNVSKQDLRKK